MINTSDHHTYLLGAAIFIAAALLFASGYYVGRADGIDELIDALRQERFSHTIDTVLSTEQFTREETAAQEESAGEEGGAEIADEDLQRSDLSFVARLTGFGTRTAAESYRLRLEKRGIAAEVIRRGKGWYQVSTKPCSFNETTLIVERLKKEDRLGKEVEIIAVQEHGERGEKD